MIEWRWGQTGMTADRYARMVPPTTGQELPLSAPVGTAIAELASDTWEDQAMLSFAKLCGAVSPVPGLGIIVSGQYL